MNGLIKIEINENYEQVVSARELHQKLGITQKFSDWFKYQSERLNMHDEMDFVTILGESSGGRPSTDYIFPLDIAKHLCMISGGEMAGKIRNYFIQVERAWNSPDQVMARAIQFSNAKIQWLQGRIEDLKPKADQHDLFLTGENCQPMNEVAKSLDIGRNKLFEYLRDKKVFMRNNVPYQNYLDRGYFKVIEKPIAMGGSNFNKTQTLVTSKGVEYIAKLLLADRPIIQEELPIQYSTDGRF